MKRSLLCFVTCLSLTLSVSAAPLPETSLARCNAALKPSDKPISAHPDCKAILSEGQNGNNDAYFELGRMLLENSWGKQTGQRHKRALFYLALAADGGNHQATGALSRYVATKMVGGKLPLKFSPYVDYLAMDWNRHSKDPHHPYAQYLRWLDDVEKASLNPEQLDGGTLTQMATDYENGYFLGANPQKAQKLYRLAADKGDPQGQFKTGQALYEHDPATALQYLQKAAANRSSDAMMMLGDHYGCHSDKAAARTWYEKAKALGNEYAADELASLAKTDKPTRCR